MGGNSERKGSTVHFPLNRATTGLKRIDNMEAEWHIRTSVILHK